MEPQAAGQHTSVISKHPQMTVLMLGTGAVRVTPPQETPKTSSREWVGRPRSLFLAGNQGHWWVQGAPQWSVGAHRSGQEAK